MNIRVLRNGEIVDLENESEILETDVLLSTDDLLNVLLNSVTEIKDSVVNLSNSFNDEITSQNETLNALVKSFSRLMFSSQGNGNNENNTENESEQEETARDEFEKLKEEF